MLVDIRAKQKLIIESNDAGEKARFTEGCFSNTEFLPVVMPRCFETSAKATWNIERRSYFKEAKKKYSVKHCKTISQQLANLCKGYVAPVSRMN